jgi:hypothetical protein
MGTEAEQQKDPWEKYSIAIGGFISTVNTSIRFGSGVGLDIDAEELLDVDSSNTVFRVGGLWRFTDTKRHQLDLSWFAYHRSGSATVGNTLEIEDPDGNIIIILPGTEVDTLLNIDIFQLAYSYSFLQDDRLDLAAIFGLFIMPVDIELEVSGLGGEEGTLNFTAPLPTFGLRMDIALKPKWFFRSGTQIFYLEYQNFKGSIMTMHGAVEYTPWDHIGFGLGIDSFTLKIEGKDEDYPNIDLTGKVGFHYVGLQLYARIFF